MLINCNKCKNEVSILFSKWDIQSYLLEVIENIPEYVQLAIIELELCEKCTIDFAEIVKDFKGD